MDTLNEIVKNISKDDFLKALRNDKKGKYNFVLLKDLQFPFVENSKYVHRVEEKVILKALKSCTNGSCTNGSCASGNCGNKN